MPENTNLHERIQGTGTWGSAGPASFLSYATYRDKEGRTFRLPVRVAGEHITGQVPPELQSQG